MPELISVADAARMLELDPSRVRALASAGRLPAVKIGDRWVLDRSGIAERARQAPVAGRPLSPANAWALLKIASGGDVEWVSDAARSRIRRVLRFEGLGPAVRSRLRRRAESRRFMAHPGELSHLLEDRDLVASGVSAAAALGLDLVSGAEVDGYVSSDRLEVLRKRHALGVAEAGGGANVRLRVVPSEAWHLDEPVAPVAAVAVDLLDDADPRAQAAGAELMRRLKLQG